MNKLSVEERILMLYSELVFGQIVVKTYSAVEGIDEHRNMHLTSSTHNHFEDMCSHRLGKLLQTFKVYRFRHVRNHPAPGPGGYAFLDLSPSSLVRDGKAPGTCLFLEEFPVDHFVFCCTGEAPSSASETPASERGSVYQDWAFISVPADSGI